ncbi:ImmA/IrrE family metallo-endopeptidase [bacterium]|nr:ImmA/IrrE family metallo-endopeptidase [bacterium]
MNRVNNINLSRILWSCEEHGITPEILCNQLNIRYDYLQKSMQNEEGITVLQLKKIADYFNRGLLFYLEDSPIDQDVVHSPQFRTLTGQKPTMSPELKMLIERVEKQREIFLNLIEGDGADPIDWDGYQLPGNSTQSIKRSANRVRTWLGLAENETFNSYRSKIEEKGVFVVVTNGYQGDWQIAKDDPVRGFSLYYPTYPVIVVKKQDSVQPQVFTLIHELGHLLLHRQGYVDEENDFYSVVGRERVANEFAGNVLIPDEFLAAINLENFPFDNVSEYGTYLRDYSRSWSVSTEVILRRLLNEGRLLSNNYEEYREYRSRLPAPVQSPGGNRSYRYREPTKMFGKPFVSAVLEAYSENRITLSKASTYLDNLKIPDIHKLEQNAW